MRTLILNKFLHRNGGSETYIFKLGEALEQHGHEVQYFGMHNFIDKVEWKETEKKDYVLYFGRFSEEKGIGTLIKVCKDLPDVQFIFAGTGPLEETVNGICNKYVGALNIFVDYTPLQAV